MASVAMHSAKSLGLVLVAVTLAACSGGGTPPAAAPPSSDGPAQSPPPTQRVYLATALACSNVDGQSARFTPLKVEGDGYSTTVEPVEECKELQIFNSCVYDVPVPSSGEIRLTPGNQQTATLDAAQLSATGVVTIFYARKGEGRFEVSEVTYEKDEAVQPAA